MAPPESRKSGSSKPQDSASSHRTTASSTRDSSSTGPSASRGSLASSTAFIQRHGRTYLRDTTQPYPLPQDLTELHRQCLRTLLHIQVHGAPLCCLTASSPPPKRVLEIGCGPGFWSAMCHRHFKSLGHTDVSFTGIDIAPLDSSMAGFRPDRDMQWTFVPFDVTTAPWPFPDAYFDIVFNKDMTLAVPLPRHPIFTEESLRVLKPGGVLEIWETDHAIRMLRPHVPNPKAKGKQAEDIKNAAELGAYVVTMNTPLSVPLNPHIVEYNGWLSKALEIKQLMSNPCTIVNHYLYSESDILENVKSHRLAIPFSEIRWERDGMVGVVTKDGKPYVETKTAEARDVKRPTLTTAQAALRRITLLTFIQEVQAQEIMLREINGKKQDEWDTWLEKMTSDLMNDGGTSWGECLEVGAWWTTKVKPDT